MHFPIGLLAIAVAITIAAWRTRPRWWLVTIAVLIVVGLAWSVLGILGITVTFGGIIVATVGWIYLGLCVTTMLAALLVLERRGPGGEQAAPLIGDTPFDGDANDADDPRAARELP